LLGKIPEKEIPHKITIISVGITPEIWHHNDIPSIVPSFPTLIWWSCSTINPQSPWNPKQIRKLWCLFTYEFPSHAWIWWFASGTFPLGTPGLSEFQKPTWNLVKSSPGIPTKPIFPVIPMNIYVYIYYIYILYIYIIYI
jgi:hypothetical protein